MQTWFDFAQHIMDAEIDQWHGRLTSSVYDCGGHFENML